MKNLHSGRTRFPFQLLIAVLLAFTSCDSFNVEKVKPSTNLEIGDEVVVATETVPTSGGTVIVDSPGSEIDGLKIIVPSKGYTTSKTFKISTAPITNHTLGQYFKPLTPLIQIDNGGGYSAEPMQITIPITLPKGDFAMAYYYDEMSGKLEGLPILSLTSTSITVNTRHFMAGSELSNSDDNLKAALITPNPFAKMIVSTISESVLQQQTIINSGFAPGSDDWEFINYGSYLAPGGHCAGQSMTAMWYYYEKKLSGEANLFHKFDLLNDKTKPAFMWQDNGLGYRFASTIQKDFNFDGWVTRLNLQSYLPGLVFKSFAASILVTGEPQFVLINNSAGKGGHAMIVYKVNFNEGKLYIADPNYPNNRKASTGVESIRTIDYVGGTLKAYETGLTAGANSTTMDQIGYFGKTAYIEWDRIGKRYAELLNGTIGNIAPNAFPPYTIWVKGKADQELKDGFSTNSDTLRCTIECPTAEKFTPKNGKKLIPFDIYDKDGNKIDNWEVEIFGGYIILKPGLNKIGFYIYARKNGVVDSDGNLKDLFIDFKWFNVYYSKLSINPNPIVGEPGADIKITAMPEGTAPKDAKYVWNFGDGSKEVTVKNDSIVSHKFSKEGDYTVTVELYNNATNTVVGKATAEANIAKGILGKLQKCKYLSITFDAVIYDNTGSLVGGLATNNYSNNDGEYSLKWSGNNFSCTIDWVNNSTDSKTTGHRTITGTMSADGEVIQSLNVQQNQTETYGLQVWKSNHNLSVSSVPYWDDYYKFENTYRFGDEGSSISKYITSYQASWETIDWYGTELEKIDARNVSSISYINSGQFTFPIELGIIFSETQLY